MNKSKNFIKNILGDTIRNLSPVETELLRTNGIDDSNLDYLIPDLYTKYDIYSFINSFMTPLNKSEEFAELLMKHKEDNVCICTDYDVDGVLGGVIMKRTLQKFNINVFHNSPNRITEGFGMNTRMVDDAIKNNCKLIITVDNGTSAFDVIDYAKQNGLDVIITDHHLPGDRLPNADVIINPHINNDSFDNICGAFVAFKLCNHLYDHYENDAPFKIKEQLIALAGIATVADAMPLINENRVLVNAVLEYLNFIRDKKVYNRVYKLLTGMGPKGIRAEGKLIDESTIAFYIAPTINAVSRMYGSSEHLIDEIIAADEYGKYLDMYSNTNNLRKQKTKELYDQIQPSNKEVDVVVFDQQFYDYPLEGLMGLLSSKLTDTEYKPSFVGVHSGGEYKFSARSISGYNIHDAIERITETHPDLIKSFGGHAEALGMRIDKDSAINEFIDLINEDYKLNKKPDSDKKVIYEFTQDLMNDCSNLPYIGPYGTGFKNLTFHYIGTITEICENNGIKIGDYIFTAMFSTKGMESEIGDIAEVLFQFVKSDNNTYMMKICNIERI